jgi:hypothetical protein
MSRSDRTASILVTKPHILFKDGQWHVAVPLFCPLRLTGPAREAVEQANWFNRPWCFDVVRQVEVWS